jgi:hypothetical protein
MKVSIRTAYRIVKKTEDPESDPIFIPQYQEEGSEDWHTFNTHIHGKGGGYNTIYFYTLNKAGEFLVGKIATEDVVVHYKDDGSEWTKDIS